MKKKKKNNNKKKKIKNINKNIAMNVSPQFHILEKAHQLHKL